MVAQRKQKKLGETFNAKLMLTIKSGKYTFGFKSSLRNIINGQAKLIIISSNFPALWKSELEYYAMLAKIDVHHFPGSTACGRYHRIGVLNIIDQGDSDLLQAYKE